MRDFFSVAERENTPQELLNRNDFRQYTQRFRDVFTFILKDDQVLNAEAFVSSLIGAGFTFTIMERSYIDYLKESARYSSKQEIGSICFKALMDFYERVKQIKGIEKLIENKIRDLFIIDLEENNNIIRHALDNYIISIIPESYDAQKRKRSDIQFILPILKRDLVFECKRLASADKRYLEEGLIRFINMEYAEN